MSALVMSVFIYGLNLLIFWNANIYLFADAQKELGSIFTKKDSLYLVSYVYVCANQTVMDENGK